MSRQDIWFFSLKLRQSHDFSTSFFYCRSTVFGLSFHSKIARNSIIWANLGPLQSCLFYHLDTISFPMNNRVCIVLSKSNISCMGTWGTDWLRHLDTSTLNYTFSAVCYAKTQVVTPNAWTSKIPINYINGLQEFDSWGPPIIERV